MNNNNFAKKTVKEIRGLREKERELLVIRNKALVQEAVLGELNYTELGIKYGMTKQMVGEILSKFNINFRSSFGNLPKSKKRKERQSKSMMGKNVGKRRIKGRNRNK